MRMRLEMRSVGITLLVVVAAMLSFDCGRPIMDPDRKLLNDVIEGSPGGVRIALAAGGNVHQIAPDGKTVLMWACARASKNDNALEVVDLLLAAGARVNARDKVNGGTALGWAASSSNRALVERLVEAGAKVNVELKNGWTPLMSAANYGDSSVVEYLLESGAEIDAVDSRGRTALDIARERGTDAVGILERADAARGG